MNELFARLFILIIINYKYTKEIFTMALRNRGSDAVHWYMQEISSRVVAESGIASDRHHLGKLILQGFKDDPNFIATIDGATDEKETFGSSLKRSIQCATAFRKIGLKHGDVIVIMAPNHIHITIPMYAALYVGVGVSGIDMTLGVNELRDTFKFNEPKIIFCQKEKEQDVELALQALQHNAQIVTFDKGGKNMCFSDFLDKYGSDASIENFQASDFDPNETIALLVATSGTTGLPKSAAVSHKNFAVCVPYMWTMYDKFPTPTRLPIVFSPIQWYSALFKFVFSPILRHTRLQSSAPMTQEHAYDIINKYRPTYAMSGPNMLTTFFKIGEREKCDFTCFEVLLAGGSAVHPSLFDDVKAASPNTQLKVIYGMSELSGIAFDFDATQPTSLGRMLWNFNHKLVDPETLKEVTEPNKPGELWVKGPGVFKGYYNNPEVTSQMLMEGGWLRTGDIMRRDENWNFYFVDRMKLLLKYRNHHISPLEIESVIAKHPGVFEVTVTGIPHREHGDLPIAFVVLHEGYNTSEQEIKDLVKNELTDSKQLRGGVVFLKSMPLTSTSKVDRQKLAAIARKKEVII
ncbi:unnamed protein product, partial [Brenthis ino]